MAALPHLVADEARPDAWVSSKSRWKDPSWLLDFDKVGVPPSDGRLHWNLDLGSEGNLLDPAWADLLEDCRKLASSLMLDACSGPTFDALTIAGNFRGQLNKLVRWMAENDYRSFSELDGEASWEFHDHILAIHRRKKNEKVAPHTLQNDLRVLVTIYKQSPALEAAGVRPIPDTPYDGMSPVAVAKAAANTADGWIRPLPDAVALRILDRCMRWMGARFDDVLAVRDLYLRTTRRSGDLELLLAGFKFAHLPDEPGPWYAALGASAASDRDATPGSRDFRELLLHAMAACVGLVQGTTGMRISEIAALPSGFNDQTRLPSCVKLERSKTGLNELFFIESQVTKIHDGRLMKWVVGMRPVGSDYLPPAVHALIRLTELFRPWHDARSISRLIVNPGGTAVVRRPHAPKLAGESRADIAPANRTFIADRMKAFVAEHGGLETLPDTQNTPAGQVDLRPYKEGTAFKSHQWRKSFALYVLRTDPQMLPALAQHFKHMSLAMTEQGYIGNDPELIDSIDSVRRQRTVQFLLEQATGKTVIAGGMADLVRDHRGQLKAVIGDAEGEEAYVRMEAWVLEADLRIWFADHGKCLMSLSPKSARCHALGGTDPWIRREPNYAERNPRVCGGCKCFAVDGEHAAFWQERHRRNANVLAKQAGPGRGEYNVALERVRQSAAILRTLGIKSKAWVKVMSVKKMGSNSGHESADPIERELLDALTRLKAGKPKHKELAVLAKRGELRVNVTNVAKEAGRSRTLIGYADCQYPMVRDRVLALKPDPGNPTTMREVVTRRREETEKLRRELQLSLTHNATLLARILRLETDVTRVARENKRRRDRLPIAQIVQLPIQD